MAQWEYYLFTFDRLAGKKYPFPVYSRNRQQGVYLVPSLVRPDSFDPFLINMGFDEMRRIIRSGLFSSLSDPDQCDLKGVYF